MEEIKILRRDLHESDKRLSANATDLAQQYEKTEGLEFECERMEFEVLQMREDMVIEMLLLCHL
jgi:hypothetical protein